MTITFHILIFEICEYAPSIPEGRVGVVMNSNLPVIAALVERKLLVRSIKMYLTMYKERWIFTELGTATKSPFKDQPIGRRVSE